MGNANCNSSSAISQRCTACGHGTCDCTAGLDSQCRTCHEHYKYNVPGTYDAQYDQWIKDNPKPVEPRFDPMPDIVAGDFICQQCTQCQEFSNLSGKSVTITDPSQAMSCIGKIEAAINSQTAAEAAEKAAADTAAWHEAQRAAGLVPTPGGQPTQNSNTWLYILLIMLVILIGVIIGYFAMLDDEPAQAPQMQQYQQPMPQYAPPAQYAPAPQYQQPPSYFQVQNAPQMYPPAQPMQPYVQYPAPQYTNL